MSAEALNPISHRPSALLAFRLILLLLTLLGFRVASWSESSDDSKNCASAAEGSDVNLAIDLCTGAIQAGQVSDQELAISYSNRGFAYYKKSDYDRAIHDFDRAIGLQSTLATAFIRRADTYQAKRKYEDALTDYEAAAQLDSDFHFERSKGFVLFYLGRMSQSAETFERYMKSDPADIRVILFHYLAEAKISNIHDAGRELEADAARLKERSWPAPIIDFHLGKIDEKAMFAAANDPDPKLRTEKICTANFHAGEHRLLRAYVSGAITLLRAAAKDCPPLLYESHGASAELQRLGQK
ncbi:MAG TPA: tetratricopeptide repeat protein [Candidatus Binatia bacterium]